MTRLSSAPRDFSKSNRFAKRLQQRRNLAAARTRQDEQSLGVDAFHSAIGLARGSGKQIRITRQAMSNKCAWRAAKRSQRLWFKRQQT
jgi:hypothetical protein